MLLDRETQPICGVDRALEMFTNTVVYTTMVVTFEGNEPPLPIIF